MAGVLAAMLYCEASWIKDPFFASDIMNPQTSPRSAAWACVLSKRNNFLSCLSFYYLFHWTQSNLILRSSMVKFTRLCRWLFVTPWPIQSMEFSSPGDLSNPGIKPSLLHLRLVLYQLSHQERPRILEWAAYPFSSGSSQPRNRTGVSCIAGGFFNTWVTRETPKTKHVR